MNVRELFAELRLKDFASSALKTINKAFDGIKTGIGKAQSGFGTMAKNFKSNWPQITAGGVALIGTMKNLTEAYIGQDNAILQISGALKGIGKYSPETQKKFEDIASSIQKVTTVGDEASLGLMSTAINMGVAFKDVESATKGAIGLSRMFAAKGLDQRSAMDAISKAYSGNWMMLQRLMPELQNMKTTQEKNIYLQKKLATGWKMELDATKGVQGQMTQFNNSLGDVKESLGSVVVSLLPLLTAFKMLLDGFLALPGPVKTIIAVLIVCGVVISTLIPIVTGFGVALSAALWPVTLVVAGIAALIAIASIMYKNLDKIVNFFKVTVPQAFISVINALKNFAMKWGQYFLILLGPIGLLIKLFIELQKRFDIIGKIGGAFKAIGGIFTGGGKQQAVGGTATSVNDAIITKNGDIVKTHPDDNIIATKSNPYGMLRGGQNITLSFGDIVIGNTTPAETRDNIRQIISDAMNDVFKNQVATMAGV